MKCYQRICVQLVSMWVVCMCISVLNFHTGGALYIRLDGAYACVCVAEFFFIFSFIIFNIYYLFVDGPKGVNEILKLKIKPQLFYSG